VRGFAILIVLCLGGFVIDHFAFESQYSKAVWRAAAYQGQNFRYEVKRWLDKVNF
jgi:hypothetical protein